MNTLQRAWKDDAGPALWRHAMLGCGALVLFWIVFRNSGLYAIVVDETLYSRFSRLLPLSASSVPGYLYLALFRTTSVCGDEFLGCARLLNAAAFVAAAPFIYLCARRVCGRMAAGAVALLALLGPINVYTAYFMPEATYFLCFWILTWYVLRFDRHTTHWSFGFCGLLFGVCALVKPHAILFAPALLAFALIITWKKDGARGATALKNILSFLACAIVVKFGVGYAMAGRAGLTLMGTAYGSIADSGLSSLSHYAEILWTATEVATGHLLVLSLIFGMPIAAAICMAIVWFRQEQATAAVSRVALYAALMLACLVLVVALFTATVPYADPNQAVNRLHMRYYNFALPLLLLIAAGSIRGGAAAPFGWRISAAVPLLVAAVYAVATELTLYESSYVDNPELRGIVLDRFYFFGLGALSIGALLVWIFHVRMGATLYLCFYAPAFALLATNTVNKDLVQRKTPDVYDRAGIVAKKYLSDEDISRLMVVGSDAAGLMRASMYLDNALLATKEVAQGAEIDVSTLPQDREWVLSIGATIPPGRQVSEVLMGGFSLSRIESSTELNFTKNSWPGLIGKTHGLSSAESWGTWSSGKIVSLQFQRPLPKRFAVHLKGRAFSRAPDNEFVMNAGSSSKSFSLSANAAEELTLEFDNDARSNRIEIEIPNPISPRELGQGEDERLLGIALYKLRVVPR